MSKLDKLSGELWEIAKIGITRTKLDFPKDDFPIPQNYIDVQRQTKSSVLHEASIDDWNMDGDKSLSEPWIGVTRLELLNKNPAEGHM